MKRLTFTRAHRLNQLADEVATAFPAWFPTGPDGRRTALASIQGDGDRIVIEAPDDATEAAVAVVVNAHVADAAYTADPQRQQAAQYLRNTIGPLLPGLIAGTATLTNAQRDRSIAALCVLVRDLYQQDV